MPLPQRYLSKGELNDLSQLLNHLDLSRYFHGDVQLTGCDPILHSPHRLGEAVSSVLALEAIAAASLWEYRTQQINHLALHMHDAIHFLHPTHFIWQSGYKMNLGAENVPTNGFFKCRDGRHIMIESGPPYPHLLNGYLELFNCANKRETISAAISGWGAIALEEQLAQRGLPGCMVRTQEEWLSHPQGKILSLTPVIEIEKIADGVPFSFSKDPIAPLTGINVLDFTHVLAGPRSTYSLAEFGANVLHIASPYHPDTLEQNLGVNRGKRSAYLDLNNSDDRQRMLTLLKNTDVFAQSYRPSVTRKFQFTPEEISHLNPHGMIYLSINAYGHCGPWQDRPGFDQNAQMVSGFSATEGRLEAPAYSPVFYLNDLVTAYFASAGMMRALLYRATEGGSYHVKVSLTRSAMWVQDLGYIDSALYQSAPDKDIYPAQLVTENCAFGKYTHLDTAVKYSHLPKLSLSGVKPFGADEALF